MPDTEERVTGMLVGLAIGDAMGRPVEGLTQQEIVERHGTIDELIGGGVYRKPPGTVTDDTEMMQCVMKSLLAREGFYGSDVAMRLVDWYESNPFDIGVTTTEALYRIAEQDVSWWDAGEAVWDEMPEGQEAGNGSLVRCPPYSVWYSVRLDELVQASRDSSRITHYDERCQWGCAALNLVLACFLRSELSPEDALKHLEGAPESITEAVAQGVSRKGSVKPTGYVVDTLHAGLYDGLNERGPRSALIRTINRGGDADSAGAITGAVAGARFGYSALPDEWLDALSRRSQLVDDAKRLYRHAPGLR